MTLGDRAMGFSDKPLNMQEDGAAFEGWALILKTKTKYKTIILDADEETKSLPEPELKAGHYNRFLFRVMCFAECYDWFAVSDKIMYAVERFKSNFYSDGHILVNNLGEGEAGDNANLENYFEGLLVKPDISKKLTGLSQLYRQLPVGLFLKSDSDANDISDTNRIFTGGKSAIDLWGLNNDTLSIYELKVKNDKVGVLTELFFYACYVHDMYCVSGQSFMTPRKPKETEKYCRGYNILYNNRNNIAGVKAYILADNLHPSIGDDVVYTMKDMQGKNLRNISFEDPIIYNYETTLFPKK